MPSSSAVRPLACVKVRRFWISSVLVVNGCDQFRPVVELNQEKLVLGIGGFEELRRGQTRLLQFGAHAAAGIEDEADRERRIFAGEGRDLLLSLFFEELEVFFFQAGDEAVQRIGDGDVDQNEVRVDADAGRASARLIGLFGGTLAAGSDGGGALAVRSLRRSSTFRCARRRRRRLFISGQSHRYQQKSGADKEANISHGQR